MLQQRKRDLVIVFASLLCLFFLVNYTHFNRVSLSLQGRPSIRTARVAQQPPSKDGLSSHDSSKANETLGVSISMQIETELLTTRSSARS
jgi:hypothetical protein